MIYAGIGSRLTPPNILEEMTNIGFNLAKLGWTLRSGHADGADLAFEDGAIQAGGNTEIFVPWPSFNDRFKGADLICAPYNAEAEEVASRYHPNWAACSQAAKKLHTRNVYQIAGLDLSTPVEMVICWTKNASGAGGTGQAIRIAKDLNIPIFDLADQTCWKELDQFVESFS